MEDFKRIVEINGVKIEVDLRTAKRVDHFKVGDPVKLLVKGYGNTFEAHSAVIVGFDEFVTLPAITVAYVKNSYSGVELSFVSITKETKDYEIAPLQDYELKFDYNKCLLVFDRDIDDLEKKAEGIRVKKKFFIENYQKYFSHIFKEISE